MINTTKYERGLMKLTALLAALAIEVGITFTSKGLSMMLREVEKMLDCPEIGDLEEVLNKDEIKKLLVESFGGRRLEST